MAVATVTPEEARLWQVSLDGEEKVVTGPDGEFTLNAKHDRDSRIYVNRTGLQVYGASTHHVAHPRHEAQRAARATSSGLNRVDPVQADAVDGCNADAPD